MKVLFVIFCSLLFSGLSSLFPHYVWLYWDDGYQTIDPFGKACFQRLKSLHVGTDWEITLIDKSTIHNWLDEKDFTQLNQIFSSSQVQLAIQTKVDFYRLFFLRKYGGVWLDVTNILHQNLNWLDNLKQNPYVLNKDLSQEPQFFYFYINRQTKQIPYIQYQGKTIYTRIDGQNSMLAAKKQSRFINDLLSEFKNLIMFGKPYYLKAAQDLNFPFSYRPYWMAYLATAMIQHRSDKAFRLIMKQGLQIPMANFYKIWGISRGIGLYHQTQAEKTKQIYENEPNRGDQAKYITKVHHFGPQQFINSMLKGDPVQIQRQTSQFDNEMYMFRKKYIWEQLKCLYQLRIDQYSIVNKYLLSKIDVNQYFKNTKITKYNQLPYICRITDLRELKQILQVAWQWMQYSFWIFITIQILVQYLFFFKISRFIKSQTNLDKQQLKNFIFKQVVLIILLYYQMFFIHSQYELWTHQSPTAILVSFFQFCVAIIVLKNIGKVQNKVWFLKISFYVLVVSLVFFEYAIEYEFTVWKYEGIIYNYQTLTRANLQKLKEDEKQIIKIFVLVLFTFLFRLLGKIKNGILKKEISTTKQQGQNKIEHFDLSPFQQSN